MALNRGTARAAAVHISGFLLPGFVASAGVSWRTRW
jgi:hypothetical protein